MPSKNLDQNNLQLIRHNTSLAKKLYPNINRARIQALRELTKQFGFSFASGDVIQLENNWFVTHTGLVRLARRKRCRGIHVEAVDSLCDSAANRFVLKATVYPSKDSAGFVGYGDADPRERFSVGPRRSSLSLLLGFRPPGACRPLGDLPSLLWGKSCRPRFAPFSCTEFGQRNCVRVLFLFAHGLLGLYMPIRKGNTISNLVLDMPTRASICLLV